MTRPTPFSSPASPSPTSPATPHAAPGAPASATMADVLAWAEASGEGRDALCELRKVPARMDMLDEEMNLIPADPAHFEKVIAPRPYPACRAKDAGQALRRGNSRLRALLGRFFAAHGRTAPAPAVGRSYDPLIAAVAAAEGFVEKGAPFATSTHLCLLTLRARARVALPALDQAEIDRIWAEATTEKRKSLRRAIELIERLRRGHNAWPHIAALLPPAPLAVPAAPDRARRIRWESLPAPFRDEADEILRRALRRLDDLKAWARAELEAGRPAEEIDAEISELRRKHARLPRNHVAALTGYRQAVTWLLREQARPEDGFADLPPLRDLFTIPALEAACAAQIARSEASAVLKDPRESTTLWSRFTNLTTLARHGLRDTEILARLRIVRLLYEDYLVSPSAMTAEAHKVCDRLRHTPELATTFINAPSRLHALATEALERAKPGSPAEEHALRLFAVAAAYAIQVSRPLRPANLFGARVHATEGCRGNLRWRADRTHAEIRFRGAEVKNGQPLAVHVVGGDAEVLWDWHKVHRPRLMKLRTLPASPYLFPGTATPRLRRAELTLPPGAMSPAAVVELWDIGDRALGLGLTPHQCRHAVATLWLAVRPGDFAGVASVLANTEEVAKRHYGKDSGEGAALVVREALLARHPDIFRRMKETCHAAYDA